MTNKISEKVAYIKAKYDKKNKERRDLFESHTRDGYVDGEVETYGMEVPYHTGRKNYSVPLTVLWQIENEMWEKNRFKWRYMRSIGLKIAIVMFLLGIGVGIWVTPKLFNLGII